MDVLVNNAAGNFLAATEDLSPRAFDAVVRIVLHGTFHMSTAVGRRMIASGKGGSILNILTTYAWTGSAFVVPSAAAKAGVLAMTRSLAVEWAAYGIRWKTSGDDRVLHSARRRAIPRMGKVSRSPGLREFAGRSPASRFVSCFSGPITT